MELGFSDHTPFFFDEPDYYFSFRMRPEQQEDYVETLSDLRKEYEGRIRIRIGLETEYYPKLFSRLMDFLRQFSLDYLLLCQHALYNETESVFSPRAYLQREAAGSIPRSIYGSPGNRPVLLLCTPGPVLLYRRSKGL